MTGLLGITVTGRPDRSKADAARCGKAAWRRSPVRLIGEHVRPVLGAMRVARLDVEMPLAPPGLGTPALIAIDVVTRIFRVVAGRMTHVVTHAFWAE
jgi:hypothetical protein